MGIERISFGRNIEVVVPTEKLEPRTRLYVAGPYGFAQSTQEFHECVCDLITKMGGEVLDPWKLAPADEVGAAVSLPLGLEQQNAWRKLNPKIGEKNAKAIAISNGLVAMLDGVDVDSGTSSEIGFSYGSSKVLNIRRPIIGYRGDFRLSADNIGSDVNLQVEYFIRASGGTIIKDIRELPEALLQIFREKAGKTLTP